MRSQDVVVEMVFVRSKAQLAVADIVFDTRREFQYVGAHLAYFSLQMHLVAEVVIVVACGHGIVDVAEYGRVGNTRKKRSATTQGRFIRHVGIDVMLFERQMSLVDVQSYGCQIIACVGF